MTLRSVIGHKKEIELIKHSIKEGKLAKAYLFSGPEGTGKFLVAKSLAKAVNCLNDDPDGCNSCASCLKIDSGQHPDVFIVDNGQSEEIKIEDIRNIQDRITLRAYEGKIKVFILNNAHNMNIVAANAFLKTLEEPPTNSLIILVSDRQKLLLDTIVSRCYRIKFSTLEIKEVEDFLSREYSLSGNILHYISFLSEGRLGMALRLKDQDVIKEKNLVIDAFTVPQAYNSGLESYINTDRDYVRKSLNILATWFRDIYMLKAGKGQSSVINLDRKDALSRHAGRYTFSELDNIMNKITESLFYLEQNVNTKLLLADLAFSIRAAH